MICSVPDAGPTSPELGAPDFVNVSIPSSTSFDDGFSAVADVNGDGLPDIVGCDLAGPVCFTLLNQGGGSFSPPITSPMPVVDEANLAFGTFVTGGHGDLAIAWSAHTDIWIVPGDGKGGFGNPILTTAPCKQGTLLGGVEAADVTGDGNLDLLITCDPVDAGVCNGCGPSDFAVLPGNGDGTFGEPVFSQQFPSPSGEVAYGPLLLADLNGDGLPDIINSITNKVFLNQGGGRFGPGAVAGSGIIQAVGDLNEDGIPDLISVGTDTCKPRSPLNLVSVFLGKGDGTFEAGPIYEIPDDSLSYGDTAIIGVSDVNGDGHPDVLLWYDGFSTVSTVGVFLGDGKGHLDPNATRYPLLPFATGPSFGDLTGTGASDVVFTKSSEDSPSGDTRVGVQVLFAQTTAGSSDGGTASGASTSSSGTTRSSSGSGTTGSATGAATTSSAGGGTTGRSSGSTGSSLPPCGGVGLFQTPSSYQPVQSGVGALPVAHLAAADFNQDGVVDFAVAGTNAWGVNLGYPDGGFSPQLAQVLPAEPYWTAAVGDFNRDGKPDLAVATYDALDIFLGNGDGTFQTERTLATAGSPASIWGRRPQRRRQARPGLPRGLQPGRQRLLGQRLPGRERRRLRSRHRLLDRLVAAGSGGARGFGRRRQARSDLRQSGRRSRHPKAR